MSLLRLNDHQSASHYKGNIKLILSLVQTQQFVHCLSVVPTQHVAFNSLV